MQRVGANEVSTYVTLPAADYSAQERERFYRSLDSALRQDPAVSAVSIATVWSDGTTLERTDPGGGEQAKFARAPVMAVFGSLDFQETSLLEGRLLNAQDSAGSPAAALISRSLAETLWPGRSPVGENLRFADGRPEVTGSVWRVVGVVSDRPDMTNLLSSSTAMVYVPLSQVEAERISISVKASDPGAGSRMNLERAAVLLGRFLRDHDPGRRSILEYDEDRRMIVGLVDSLIALSFGCVLFALSVALVGVYGLTQNSVQLMTQEIGTRRALGATDGRISRMLLLSGSRQVLIGFLVAALVTSPLTIVLMRSVFLASVLVQVAASMACLYAVVTLAIYFPIRNILKMEPADALRYE